MNDMRIVLKNSVDFQKIVLTKGHTQTSLAKKLDISRNYLYKIIQGSPLSAKLANKICEALGFGFEEFFLIKVITKVNNSENNASVKNPA